jgi:alkylhydroperoxidase/carboxymuconolactone decarboxylase family protein YurZ
MCCHTGVCGPEVDPALVAFAADLEWLAAQGVAVERVNLAQQPQRFAQDVAIRRLLDTRGDSALPAIVVDGEIRHFGGHPDGETLARWARLPAEVSLFTEEVAELVALGAAIASNYEPCFKFHYDRARKLGVSDADMRRAVELAQQVKEAPARGVLDLARRYLEAKSSLSKIGVAAAIAGTSAGGCCEPAAGNAQPASTKCC